MDDSKKNTNSKIKLSKSESFFNLAVLSITVFILLIATTIQAYKYHDTLGIIITSLIVIGVSVTIVLERRIILNQEETPDTFLFKVTEFFAVIFGGVTTFYLSNELGLGVVIASSLVGVLTAIIFPKYKFAAYCGAAYCGSFIGMSSTVLLKNYNQFILASVIAGLIFVFAKNVLSGFGGKLGVIAFTNTIVAILVFNRKFLSNPPITDLNTIVWIILVGMIAASLSFYFNNHLNHGPVLASGIVGLTGGLLLPAFFPEIGDTLAIVAICASFAGMSTQTRFPHFILIMLVGILTGLLFILSTPVFGGAGGKLGTIAYSSVATVYGFTMLWKKLKKSP